MTDVETLAAKGRRAYMKEWRGKNRVKVHEYNLRYWAKKAVEFATMEQAKGE